MNQLKFVESVESVWPVPKWRDFSVLVAVSGGSDSVGLLRATHDLHQRNPGHGKLVAVHVNHGLRQGSADHDEQFVKALCQSLKLDCRTVPLHFDKEANHAGESLEGRLREQRYQVFQDVAAEVGARYLLTGHTRDDQVETILFRIMRGTGIDGLAGIPFQRQLNPALTVVRPMLQHARTEIVEYLNSIGQDWREDDSNRSAEFTRNRIRHELLPQMRGLMGEHVDQSLLSLATHADRYSDSMKQLALPILKSEFRVEPGRILVLQNESAREYPEIFMKALRMAWREAGFPTNDMNREKWDLLSQCLNQANAKSEPPMFPGGVRVSFCNGQIQLSRSKAGA